MTGFEPLIAAAAAGLTSLITDTIKDKGGKILGRIDIDLQQTEKQIERASGEYIQRYRDRHCTLKVLGMREPVPLESVYTAVKFLNEYEILSFSSPETLEKSFRESGKRGFRLKEGEKQLGINVANRTQFLMVLGGPGAGKSTFLRRMGLEALLGKQGEFQHNCVPVLLELKNFTIGENIENLISQEFEHCSYPFAAESTQWLLQKGKLLVLLDGLDEVPTNQVNDVITQIQNFVDRYNKNRFITSCRIAAYRHNFRRFTDVAMADFDDDQIKGFINNWFQSEEDRTFGTAQRCWEILQKQENQAAKELAHTPLLLTFLCLVYDRSQKFPNQRSVLYCKALRILLEEWAAEKRILREEIYQGLNIELEEILLAEIAAIGLLKDQLFFSQREIIEQIKRFLESNLNAPKHLDGKAILNAIAVQQGILVERAEGVYSFSHLTLQEYLTAQFIVDNQKVKSLISKHITTPRWREVFLQISGLMSGRRGADDLLLLMEKQARNYTNSFKLKTILKWADEAVINSKGRYKPVAKRAGAIATALAISNSYSISKHSRNFQLAYNLICTLDFILSRANFFSFQLRFLNSTLTIADKLTQSLKLARELREIQIFNFLDFTNLVNNLESLTLDIVHSRYKTDYVAKQSALTTQILEIWFNALKLDLEVMNLSEIEAQTLSNYFYVNELIVRCKDAAVRVSPETWTDIEQRMLKIVEIGD